MNNNKIQSLDSNNVRDYIDILGDEQDALAFGGRVVGGTLSFISETARKFSVILPEAYDDIKNSYKLLSDYMLKGYKDDHRQALYDQLMQRVYFLIADLQLDAKLKYAPQASYLTSRSNNTSLDIDGLREQMEAFVSNSAMLSLESGDEKDRRSKELYDKRQKFLATAFIDIVRSSHWSKEQANDMAQLLLSPTIDSVDAQVFCSAVLMSALLSPDPYKVLSLAKVYKSATDEYIRQRALVGWTFAASAGNFNLFNDLSEYINKLLEDENVRNEIAELQIQTIYCMDAERDNEDIQKNVMPTIIKNQNLEVTRYGIREKEEDPMDDILHSDEMEKRMEEMEQSVRKMADMQKRGVDIYFGGFSKMKRFGFFYTLCNWFMPFYTQHPGLSHLSKNLLESGFMKMMLKASPFCESDKYSFALGMSSVFDKLPENIREMLGNSEEMHILGDSGADTHTPTFIRRMYLQDLFRFFRINDCRTLFLDPFTRDRAVFIENDLFFNNKRLRKVYKRVIHFLMKGKHYTEAADLLEVYQDPEDIDDILIYARLSIDNYEYNSDIIGLYNKVLKKDPENIAALKGAASMNFRQGYYDIAAKHYRHLIQIYPDKILYKINLAISLINNSEPEEGVDVLYELYYKFPDNMDVLRALAWGLLCLKRVDQAAKLYEEILSSKTKTDVDSLNAGYCAWFKGDLEKASELFRDFAKKSDDSQSEQQRNLDSAFFHDSKILDAYGISKVERDIMAGFI